MNDYPMHCCFNQSSVLSWLHWRLGEVSQEQSVQRSLQSFSFLSFAHLNTQPDKIRTKTTLQRQLLLLLLVIVITNSFHHVYHARGLPQVPVLCLWFIRACIQFYGPNEFMSVPYLFNLTASMTQMMVDHAKQFKP